MKRWRWDLILASAMIAFAIVAYGFTQRYQPLGGNSQMVLDRLTGKVCRLSAGCWQSGERISTVARDAPARSETASPPHPALQSGPAAPPSRLERLRELAAQQANLDDFDALWDSLEPAGERDPLAGYTPDWRELRTGQTPAGTVTEDEARAIIRQRMEQRQTPP